MNPIAIVQARMRSTRLPGKVLMSLAGKTVLEHVIQRVRSARLVGNVVVATTVNPQDLPIVRLCAERKISVYTGSEEDVLDRYYQAARLFRGDTIVRITSDCPVIDPRIVDRVIADHRAFRSDYTSNTIDETFPDGQDVEVFSFAALSIAWKDARLKSQREHVTPYFKDHPEIFKLRNVPHSENLRNMRWTLDQQEDYLFLKRVFGSLYKNGKAFGLNDVLNFVLQNPGIEKINNHILRNEGYKKSVIQDGFHKKVIHPMTKSRKLFRGDSEGKKTCRDGF